MGKGKPKAVIVYCSQAGLAKRYAIWLAEDLGCPAVAYGDRDSVDLAKADVVVFCSWFHAGGLEGASWLRRQIARYGTAKFVVVGVGATPMACEEWPEQEIAAAFERSLPKERCGDLRWFYCPGGDNGPDRAHLEPVRSYILNGLPLSAMGLEELWELFPLRLVESKEEWQDRYEEMEALLCRALGSVEGLRVSHIGSTAIRGIRSKDVVDVLLEVGPEEDLGALAATLERRGLIVMGSGSDRVDLNYGYTAEGPAEKVYHVHLRHRGDNDELYFRDYLNEHPSVAADYEALKLQIAERCEGDRDAYTQAKGDFIARWTQEGRQAYGLRY